MIVNRHNRHGPSQYLTCANQIYRHNRHTPLEGVTVVMLMVEYSDLDGTIAHKSVSESVRAVNLSSAMFLAAAQSGGRTN